MIREFYLHSNFHKSLRDLLYLYYNPSTHFCRNCVPVCISLNVIYKENFQTFHFKFRMHCFTQETVIPFSEIEAHLLILKMLTDKTMKFIDITWVSMQYILLGLKTILINYYKFKKSNPISKFTTLSRHHQNRR